MRYYNLTIGKGTKAFNITSENNPTPLNIQFQIQALTDKNSQVPAVIRIYNVSPSVFIKLQKEYIGEPVILEAGFTYLSPYSQKLNYSPQINKTVLMAYVESVTGNFNTHDTYVAISCLLGVSSEKGASISDLIDDFTTSENNQTQKYRLQIASNEKIFSKVAKALKELINSNLTIIASSSVALLLNNAKQNIAFTYTNLSQLITIIENEFNIAVCFDFSSSKCILYKLGDPRDFISLSSSSKITSIITRSEILAQPELINAAGELSLTTIMKPDLKLGSVIYLSGVVPTITTFNFVAEEVQGAISSNTTIFNGGFYFVKNIIHTGNFYGSDASSWCSQMQILPLSTSEASKYQAKALLAQKESAKKAITSGVI